MNHSSPSPRPLTPIVLTFLVAGLVVAIGCPAPDDPQRPDGREPEVVRLGPGADEPLPADPDPDASGDGDDDPGDDVPGDGDGDGDQGPPPIAAGSLSPGTAVGPIEGDQLAPYAIQKVEVDVLLPTLVEVALTSAEGDPDVRILDPMGTPVEELNNSGPEHGLVELGPGLHTFALAGWVASGPVVDWSLVLIGHQPATCADGVVQLSEGCDDGNEVASDGCTSCQVDDGWACTDVGGPGSCSPVFCGDGLTQGAELCDDGNDLDADGCAGCSIEPGFNCDVLGAPSVCSPMMEHTLVPPAEIEIVAEGLAPGGSWGTLVTLTAPSRLGLTVTSTTGDPDLGVWELAEDDTVGSMLAAVSSTGADVIENLLLPPGTYLVRVTAYEGGGIVEQLSLTVIVDDGPTCGDGRTEGWESCDDGNDVAGDGCQACEVGFGWSCEVDVEPSICSAYPALGVFEAGQPIDLISGGPVAWGDVDIFVFEVVEPVLLSGSLIADVPTDADLDLEVLDAEGLTVFNASTMGNESFTGEPLTPGGYLVRVVPFDDVDACTLTLTTAVGPACGNGVVEPSEACDDFNQNSFDGCSSSCQEEFPYDCQGQEPSVCTGPEMLGTLPLGGQLTLDDGPAVTMGDTLEWVVLVPDAGLVSGHLTPSSPGDLDIRVYADHHVVFSYTGSSEDPEVFSLEPVPAGLLLVEVKAYAEVPGFTLALELDEP